MITVWQGASGETFHDVGLTGLSDCLSLWTTNLTSSQVINSKCTRHKRNERLKEEQPVSKRSQSDWLETAKPVSRRGGERRGEKKQILWKCDICKYSEEEIPVPDVFLSHQLFVGIWAEEIKMENHLPGASSSVMCNLAVGKKLVMTSFDCLVDQSRLWEQVNWDFVTRPVSVLFQWGSEPVRTSEVLQSPGEGATLILLLLSLCLPCLTING